MAGTNQINYQGVFILLSTHRKINTKFDKKFISNVLTGAISVDETNWRGESEGGGEGTYLPPKKIRNLDSLRCHETFVIRS